MGGLLGWLFSGGATAILGTVGTVVNKVGGPIADAYAAKQKALTDVHGMDVKAATDITLASQQTDLRVAELYATQALADSANEKNSWMRKVAFAIAAWVMLCYAIQGTLPKLAAAIGIDTNNIDPTWGWLFLLIIGAIVGLRPLEKSANTKAITKMQSTISAAEPAKPGLVGWLAGKNARDRAGAPGTG